MKRFHVSKHFYSFIKIKKISSNPIKPNDEVLSKVKESKVFLFQVKIISSVLKQGRNYVNSPQKETVIFGFNPFLLESNEKQLKY